MGGFECADHINRQGERINLLFETEHHIRVEEDYTLLKSLGITTVREGICWSNVEKKPFTYDFSEVENRIRVAQKLGIQQLWTLCHFGYPDDLMPTHPKFTARFTELCEAFTRFYLSISDAPLFINPINEISFLSWHSGDMRGTVPFMANAGFDIKYHLCKAAIQGSKVIREIAPNATLFVCEPLIKIHAQCDEDCEIVAQLNEDQYQAIDMLTGRMCPELGGNSNLLDFIGVNYYYSNQWYHKGMPMEWRNLHLSVADLLAEIYHRYSLPLVMTETGHFGEDKHEWVPFITNEIIRAINTGISVYGACIYPVIERPDWDDLTKYCQCGLWDIDTHKNRIAHAPYINETTKGIELINQNITQNLKQPEPTRL